MIDPTKIAALYVASLKAMVLIHQHSHWTTKGTEFYGSHLLFERLYDSANDDLDIAAEKMMGLFGDAVFKYDLQTKLLSDVLNKYSNLEGSPIEMSLKIEQDFLNYSKTAYNLWKKENKMSLGLDDMIMAISSRREESVYLLKQALK